MEKEFEMSISDILRMLLSKIVWIVLAAIICGAAGFCISKFYLPLKYESYTSMYVKNVNTSNQNDSQAVNINDITASKSLVTTYIAVLSDDTVIRQIGDELIKKYGVNEISKVFDIVDDDNTKIVDIDALRDSLTMSAVNDTEVLKISAVTKSPEISVAVCNTISELAKSFLPRVVGAGSVETIGEASINRTAVYPKTKRNAALGFIAGLILSSIIVIIIEFTDNTVKDSDELAKRYDKAIIGEVHRYDSANNSLKKRYTILGDNVPFAITEAYKSIRTNMVFSMSTQKNKCFAVTSAMPGAGKSFTSANMAITFAQAGMKILLIDADMRKPVQHKSFRLHNKAGISTLLSGINTLGEVLQQNVIPNLDVITSGPIPPNPSELLSSGNMAILIDKLSSHYDYVIIDTPPIGLVTDALTLSDCISGIVLVAKYSASSYDEIDSAIKKIEVSDSHILGFILNNIHGKGSGKYYGKYDSKYGYYSEDGGKKSSSHHSKEHSKKSK